MIHYFPPKIVDHPTKWRHLHFEASSGKRATSRGVPSEPSHFFADRFRVLQETGYTDIQGTAGRREERAGKWENVTFIEGGGKKGWLVLSGRGICAPVSACIWETAMHLCMFRDYRMLLANNELAVRSTGRKPLGRHFRRGLLACRRLLSLAHGSFLLPRMSNESRNSSRD